MVAVRRILSTLCPTPADFLSLSGKKWPRLMLPRFGSVQLNYGSDNETRRWMPFPPDSHGFLYYHTPPKAPPFAGEIRFRCSSDPDSFHDGKDLLSLEQTPWSIPLYDLVNRTSYTVLRNQLIHDGLISPQMLEKWAKENLPHGPERSRAGSVLYYFHQPFFHRFDKHFLSFYAVTGKKIGFCHTSTFTKMFKHGRPVLPYGGEL